MNEPAPASAQRDESVPAKQPWRFLQFRISTMLWLTLVMALACSVFFSMPAVAGLLLLWAFSMILPAVLTIIIVYGRGYLRAFCIGAMFPAVLPLLPVAMLAALLVLEPNSINFYLPRLTEDINWLWFRVYVGGFWILSVIIGLICVGARRLVEKRPTRR